AVRENLTYIRLGSYATDHAKHLVSKKLADERLLEWLFGYDRPALIEDCPGVVPIISNGHAYGPDAGPSPDGPQGGKGFFTQTDGVKAGFTSGLNTESQAGQLIQFPIEQKGKSLSGLNISLLQTIIEAAEGGKVSSAFVTQQLGMKGKHYAGAKKFIERFLIKKNDSGTT
ncbi:MAG: hypothetical protein AAF705_15820, partial [Bacteroidota bacterium]